ncbi:MAG: Fe-S cluster assembly protein SufD [Candidatus Omnitrophica bacterium CG1_02_46_14]|nr:MAG: Fe-S cluster assembly protein SufD [Candidatus Omnitrophica bacterium CG1_02_46_14]
MLMYKELVESTVLPKETGSLGWLGEIRSQAYERFKAVGFPDRHLEEWKYTPLDPVMSASYVSSEGYSLRRHDSNYLKSLFTPTVENEKRLVFVNGAYSKEYSSTKFLPQGVLFGRLAENIEFTPDLVQSTLAANTNNETNPFSLINTFNFKDGAFVYIPDNCNVEETLNVTFTASLPEGKSEVFYPKILIILGKRAKASIVLNMRGDARSRYFNNAHAQVHLGEGSNLDYVYVQRESKKASSFLTNRTLLKKESMLNVLSFATDGTLIRNENHVVFTEPHGFSSHKGLSVLSGGSQFFHQAVMDHEASGCTSRQFYKNILSDRSKSEFNSLVHVRRDAQKSDSNQLNKNLLLSDLAQAYSRPKLKIDADDVACSHGATVGQLEKEELFYLRSRGFSEKAARFMLTYGFAEEIMEEFKPESLKKELELLVKERLEHVIR